MKNLILFFTFIICSQFVLSQDTIVKYNGSTIRGKILEITVAEVKYKKVDFLDGPTYVEMKSEIEMVKYSNGVKEHFEKPVKSGDSQTSMLNNNQNNNDYYGGQMATKKKIEEFGARYRYNDMTISERELHTMLMQTRDKKIIALTQKAKDNKAFQYVGFGGIPFGIAALYCLEYGAINQSSYNSTTGQYSRANQDKYFALAATFAIIGIACPITSDICRHNRKARTREAVRLYNEKY